MTAFVRSCGGAAVAAFVALSCAPRAGRLEGTPVPAQLPKTDLPPGHRHLVFRWEYHDPALSARGEGAARIASPDSARLDFFLDAGVGGGYAILLGDTLFTPGGNDARRYLPPVPLLWSTVGRLAVPPARDTVARVDGSILRAEIGRDPTWRATFSGERLVRLERIAGGRLEEWVSRATPSEVRYENEKAGRVLKLTITKNDQVAAFDPDIWQR